MQDSNPVVETFQSSTFQSDVLFLALYEGLRYDTNNTNDTNDTYLSSFSGVSYRIAYVFIFLLMYLSRGLYLLVMMIEKKTLR